MPHNLSGQMTETSARNFRAKQSGLHPDHLKIERNRNTRSIAHEYTHSGYNHYSAQPTTLDNPADGIQSADSETEKFF